jgi:hypothetical protein
MYTADPSARVFDGVLYIYPSHDRDDARWWDMVDWHVFSTTSMVDYTDHGVAFSLEDISWAEKFAWAPDCVKRNGKYYLSYSGKGQILYAMSDNILGPYTFEGTILGKANSGTNHHSIVEYKGRWHLFYHTADLSMQNIPEDAKERKFFKKRRCVCVEELFYNPDGTIQEVTQTKEGVSAR